MRLTKKVEDRAVFHGCDKTCLDCDGTSCGFTQAMADRLAAYEDTGFEPDEIDFCLGGAISPQEAMERYEANKKRYDEWFAWKQAEEQGRLVILPCKVGDTVFVVEGRSVYKSQVESITLHDDGLWLDGTFNHFGLVYFSGEIGRNVFLTREAADAALKGCDGDV